MPFANASDSIVASFPSTRFTRPDDDGGIETLVTSIDLLFGKQSGEFFRPRFNVSTDSKKWCEEVNARMRESVDSAAATSSSVPPICITDSHIKALKTLPSAWSEVQESLLSAFNQAYVTGPTTTLLPPDSRATGILLYLGDIVEQGDESDEEVRHGFELLSEKGKAGIFWAETDWARCKIIGRKRKLTAVEGKVNLVSFGGKADGELTINRLGEGVRQYVWPKSGMSSLRDFARLLEKGDVTDLPAQDVDVAESADIESDMTAPVREGLLRRGSSFVRTVLRLDRGLM